MTGSTDAEAASPSKGRFSDLMMTRDSSFTRKLHLPNYRAKQIKWRPNYHGLRGVLSDANASDAQLEFFEAFYDCVMKPLRPQADGEPGTSTGLSSYGSGLLGSIFRWRSSELAGCSEKVPKEPVPESTGLTAESFMLISSDFRRFYLQVEATDWYYLTTVSNHFLTDIGMPSEQLEVVKGKLDVLRAAVGAPTSDSSSSTCALWMCLDGMGTNRPRVDAGYALECHAEYGGLDWQTLDLLLPPGDDKDRVIRHAMAEQSEILARGIQCSFLPEEPLTALNLKWATGQTGGAITAMLFFKALGYVMPQELVLHILCHTMAKEVRVTVGFGPKGLVHTAVRCVGCDHRVASKLASVLAAPYSLSRLEQVYKCVRAQDRHTLTEIAAHGGRYTVAVGFQDFA